MTANEVKDKLAASLREKPRYFSELLREFAAVNYRTLLLGWSELREECKLNRDNEGRYYI